MSRNQQISFVLEDLQTLSEMLSTNGVGVVACSTSNTPIQVLKPGCNYLFAVNASVEQ
jgi:hypothetical protein